MHANLRAIAQAANADPRKTLLDRVGDTLDYEVFHNLVLVVTYIKPSKMMKGANGEDVEFHFTDKTLAEDRFQGKVGMVAKLGPMAFKDDSHTQFGGLIVEPGDWVMYRPSDGIELFIRDRSGTDSDGLPCRLIEDTAIKGRISSPTLIY